MYMYHGTLALLDFMVNKPTARDQINRELIFSHGQTDVHRAKYKKQLDKRPSSPPPPRSACCCLVCDDPSYLQYDTFPGIILQQPNVTDVMGHDFDRQTQNYKIVNTTHKNTHRGQIVGWTSAPHKALEVPLCSPALLAKAPPDPWRTSFGKASWDARHVL